MIAMAEKITPTAPEAEVPIWLTKNVVDVGDEHGDDRRHGHLRDDAAHGVTEQHVVALLGSHGFHSLILLG